MSYMKHYIGAKLYEPTDFKHREFAIKKVGQKMWRHLSFESPSKLRSFLIQHCPDHVYFSCAKYEDPSNKDMLEKRKGWLGSDLIFDIDNDVLNPPTLGEAAFQTIRLGNVLRGDFALTKLLTTFSGSRGYHIHVHDECIQSLGGYDRQQIAEYVMSYGIRIDAQVTSDTVRLIRLPGSIHGGTGNECSIINTNKEEIL